jgi:hypothetical protein
VAPPAYGREGTGCVGKRRGELVEASAKVLLIIDSRAASIIGPNFDDLFLIKVNIFKKFLPKFKVFI